MLLIPILLVAAIGATGEQAPKEPAKSGPPDALKIELVTVTGAKFAGLVDGSMADRLLEDETSLISPRKLPATAKVELSGVNGLNGKMAVKVRDVASWKLLGRVPAGEVNSKRQATEDQRKARLEEEEKRLEQERIKREERKNVEAQKNAEARAKQQKQEEMDRNAAAERLLARFPPEQGWGPEKKADIEHRRVILGLFPSEEEKAFLDSFDDWMQAFALRQQREAKLKQELEKKGAPGDKKPEPGDKPKRLESPPPKKDKP